MGEDTGPSLPGNVVRIDEESHRGIALALGRQDGATVRGDTALKAARRAIVLLQMGHLAAQDRDSDVNPSIKAPDET